MRDGLTHNPKAAAGKARWRKISSVPMTVVMEVGVAMLEGAQKYGPHNFREAPVVASDYIDATLGHMTSWIEGEDIDADSGLSHITKAIASLMILRDAAIQGTLVDDRPPPTRDLAAWKADMEAAVRQSMASSERHRLRATAPPDGEFEL